MAAIGRIFTKINKAMNTKVGKIATKTVGVGALALIGYDAHCNGKVNADSYSKLQDGEAMKRSYVKTMTTNSPSKIQSELKNVMFDLESDNKVRGFFNTIGGYLRGFGSMLISAAVPLALAIGTVATKGKASKIFAGGLAGFGIYAFGRDILGIGNRDNLNKHI